ncbi:MAG: hypothetical protein E7013_03695 [Alphaproteobacteria bacterium]|nr:hypothetical protein [Alphaproteobacteria bacterium]
MKKIIWIFSLLCMLNFQQSYANTFSISQKENILYENENLLNEYLIYTADKQCFIHYLSTNPISDDLHIEVEETSEQKDVKCFEKGHFKINILNDKNDILQTLDGFFIDGFFIGQLPLNSHVIKRSAEKNGTQNLYYFLDKNDDLKIQYVGKMQAELTGNIYTHFEVCDSFEIWLQTPNKDLFTDQTTIQNLFTVAKSYAQTLCPNIQTIIFGATDSPSLKQDGIFFKEHLVKDNSTALWMPDLDSSFNYVLNPQPTGDITLNPVLISPKKQQKQQKDETTTIETPKETEKLTVHVSNKTNKKVLFIDKPYLMKTLQNSKTKDLKEGWYKIDAYLEDMSDLEKKKTGISLNQKAFNIDIISAEKCKSEKCN